MLPARPTAFSITRSFLRSFSVFTTCRIPQQPKVASEFADNNEDSFIKRPDSRKTYIHNRYLELLKRNKTWIFCQHNNLLPEEWGKIRAKFNNEVNAKITVLQVALFRHAYGVSLVLEKQPTLNPHTKRADKLVKQLAKSEIDDLLVGPVALITFDSLEDEIQRIKGVMKVVNESQYRLAIIGAQIDGEFVDSITVEALGRLPPLQELRAELLGILSAPAAMLAAVLSQAGGGELVSVLSRRET